MIKNFFFVKKTRSSKLIAVFFLLFTAIAYSNTINPQIEMYLETPAQNETYTGVAFVRGWAVAPSGIEKIELYIDGVYISDVPIGESRTAVGELYPNYPDSDKSGFNMAYFYSKLDAGAHTAAVRAVDRNGQYKDVFADFEVTRFDTNQSNNFIRDPSIVSLSRAQIAKEGESIRIAGLVVEGVSYDIKISWNALLQGFAINNIYFDSGSKDINKNPAACARAGGEYFERVCLAQQPMCVIPYPDAGRTCSDSSECAGDCMAVKNYDGRTYKGECEDNNIPCGCRAIVKNGFVIDGICID